MADKSEGRSETPIRVLLIDDEQDLLDYISKRLRLEGLRVSTATSGARAVELAGEQDFDVAVVDLKMPGMDGIETQHELKRLQPFLQTIVLTGHGSIDAALESGREHAFRFLAKPSEHGELIEAIRAAAENKRDKQHAAFHAELAEVTAGGAGSREIMDAVAALRRKYGMPDS